MTKEEFESLPNGFAFWGKEVYCKFTNGNPNNKTTIK